MIYFGQDEATLHVKVGFTDKPDADERLRALQTGCPSPIVLLGTIPGDRDTERQLHQQFAQARVAGEWFRPVPGLLRLAFSGGPRDGSRDGRFLPSHQQPRDRLQSSPS